MFEYLLPHINSYSLPPTPAWYQYAAITICVFAIYLPPGPIRLSTGLPLIALIYHATFFTYAPTYQEYAVSTGCVSAFFAWVDFIACHRLERDFWRIKKINGHVIRERAPSGLWAKLKWSTLFWFGHRKIGWNIQISSIPPPVPDSYPRTRFLKDVFLRGIKMALGLDLACLVLRALAHSRQHPDFFSEPIIAQVLAGWATVLRAYCGISVVYQIVAFVALSLSLTSPSKWPPVNGSLRDNFYSVRKAWGRLWHQFIRRYTSSAGRAVTKCLGFRKGSFMSRYTQLWVGYVIGALMHVPPTLGWSDKGFWQAIAFVSQPAAIMFEDWVIHLGKRAGLRDNRLARCVGYLWVVAWFSYSLRFWVATVPARYSEGRWLCQAYWYISTELSSISVNVNLSKVTSILIRRPMKLSEKIPR